jgi:hypothetical protein
MPILFWLPMILFAGMYDVANDAIQPAKANPPAPTSAPVRR